MPTLLDLPTEILDIILNMLSHKFELVDTSYRLLYCLLFKEQTSAYALKNLYQDPAKFYLEKDRIVNLFSTLLASIRGCTTIPYHHSVEKFTDRTWRLYLSREIDAFGWMPEISTKLLQTGQLRELILSFPRDFVLKDKSTTFDVSMLKRLTVKSWSIEAGNITKEWMETLLPKMRLESLEILAGWTRLG